MSTYIEYIVDQGATFKTQLQIKNDVGTGLNLASYLVTGQVRKSYYSLNATANITCTMIDAPNGTFQLVIPADETANIRAGRYVFDVEARSNTTTEIVRLIEGMMTFTPGVTR
jgi:uncharacterized cupin superfamily protein